jgi:hypothetical protein
MHILFHSSLAPTSNASHSISNLSKQEQKYFSLIKIRPLKKVRFITYYIVSVYFQNGDKILCYRLFNLYAWGSPLDWFMQEKSYWNSLALKLERDKVRPIAIISISGYKVRLEIS